LHTDKPETRFCDIIFHVGFAASIRQSVPGGEITQRREKKNYGQRRSSVVEVKRQQKTKNHGGGG